MVPELEKFRQKFPDYNDLPDGELAQRLAEKFPDYADLPAKVQGQTSTSAYGVAETIDRPSSLSLQEWFPSTTRPGLRPNPQILPAVPMDILRLAGALPGTAVNVAEDLSQGRGFHPGQAFTSSMRGGRGSVDPNQESRAARQVAELAVGMVPLQKPIQALGQMAARGMETLQLPSQFPQLLPRRLTVPDVLATPEARLPKLTKLQQGVYFRTRASQLRFQNQATLFQLKQERLALQKELGTASTERALELRQRIPEYMGRQSAQYRTLADQELAPMANEVVETKRLADYVQRRWGKDPEALTEVSARLNLGNEALEKVVQSPLLDDLGRPIQQVVPGTVKLGDLYTKAKEFGQELPSAVRQSLRTYNRDEHFIDNTIDTLYGFLKEQGIDLSAGNQFWRTWAPVRDQLVRESRPYNLAGTQTATFSRRLYLQARGIDPDNKNYAETIAKGLFGDEATVDELVGPIKQLVSKLDSNQKSIVAQQLAAPAAQEALSVLRDQVKLLSSTDPRRGFHILTFIKRWLLPGVMGGRSY